MLNSHTRKHCDQFNCKQTTCVSHNYGYSERGSKSEIQAVFDNKNNRFSNAQVWKIWHKLKITEFEYQYWARKLCFMLV